MRAVVRCEPPYPADAFVLVPGKNLVTGAAELGRQVGNLSTLEEDLLTLGAAVFAVDLAAKRGEREQITRSIELSVPVVNYQLFERHRNDIAYILWILSRDNWTITFERKAGTPESASAWPDAPGKTLLFSGGLDSLAGAVQELDAGTNLLLASHYTRNRVTKDCQETLYDYLSTTYPSAVSRVAAWVTGRTSGDLRFPPDADRESSQRTRSFLFLTIGAIASRRKGFNQLLMIAENGQMAIHVPLTAARMGAFSTHTAHPQFVREMQAWLSSALEFDIRVVNPFLYMTKAECIERVVTRHRATIPVTVSCWRISRQSKHCGECIPCLVRRIAVEYNGVFLQEYERDLLAEDIGRLQTGDNGKRNIIELLEFVNSFSESATNAELRETYTDLINRDIDEVAAIAMYRRFAAEVRAVLVEYPQVMEVMQ